MNELSFWNISVFHIYIYNFLNFTLTVFKLLFIYPCIVKEPTEVAYHSQDFF